MKGLSVVHALLLTGVAATPIVVDRQSQVTYRGFSRNDVDVFLNIPYGQDTSGEHRFKPPRPFVPPPGTVIDATSAGPACPQTTEPTFVPLVLTQVTSISEDCLNLNIERPKNGPYHGLPVMVFIHGGTLSRSFIAGQNTEITTTPDGLIQQSVENGHPVIHVGMNYRLGVFGFAQSRALKSEKSENAGLRDQRLAIEWVRDNIRHFGGDPENITIFGQSSGGLAVGLQIMAFGASKPVPFQKGICESQALEPGITGTFTIDAMKAVVDRVGCDDSPLNSPATVACLRCLDTATLLNASLETFASDIGHNFGDLWLPVVDDDFLPAAPSQLIYEGRFANVSAMIGWCEDDVTFFISPDVATKQDTRDSIASYLPGMDAPSITQLLSLYPSSAFSDSPVSNLTAEFYRTGRIVRDVIMTCMPIWYGENLARAGNPVYLYDFNQTILTPSIDAVAEPGLGVPHTSEFAYIFGNLSHYDTGDLPYHVTRSDVRLRNRASRSWSSFAALGHPSIDGAQTFQGWDVAFGPHDETSIFVAGGPHEGLSPIAGADAEPSVRRQHLRKRCGFLNSREIIAQLQF